MKIGDYVEVKEGVKDPDNDQFDMSGWRGVITDVSKVEKSDEIRIIEISWDSDTLKKIPKEFIEDSISEGYSFSEMNLAEDEVIKLSGALKPEMKGRELVIKELENKYGYASFDAQNTRISEILGTTDLQVTSAKLLKYRKYLIENLEEPVYLTGVEDFPWEERFVFGYGSQQEYAKLKRTRPSYKDTFELKKILEVDKSADDLLAKVTRKSDSKTFEIRLSELKGIEEESNNYRLLYDFSVWIVNN